MILRPRGEHGNYINLKPWECKSINLLYQKPMILRLGGVEYGTPVHPIGNVNQLMYYIKSLW